MKHFRIFAIVAMAVISGASAQAGAISGVVLSNMGADGNTSPTSGASQNVNGLSRLAVAFTVGASDFTLSEINIGAFGTSQSSGPANVTGTLSIHTDAAGSPSTPSGIVQTFATQTMGGDGNYTFDYRAQAGKVLSAGQKYWIILTTNGSDSSWYFNASTPTTFPPGGVTYNTTMFRDVNGSPWGFTGTGYFAIAGSPTPISAVPEPALTSLLCLGGVALIRRRMKK